MRSERGQAIILFVGLFSVVLVIAAIVVDFGLWFAERRTAQRVADLAAAAGAVDLPAASGAEAFLSACDWAARNGFEPGNVDVEIFERGSSGVQEGCESLPSPVCGSQCDTVRVTVSNDATRLFTALPFFGIDPVAVGAVAAAGVTSGAGIAGVPGPDQTILLMDAQRATMGTGCNRHPATCAMGLARTEAHSLVDAIAGGAGAQVGYVPYTQCYDPDLDLVGNYPCVSRTIVIDPTSQTAALHTAVDATYPISMAAANLCMPLLEAQRMFELAPSSARRTVIFLSDGDSRYNHNSTWNNLPYPPEACRPDPFDENFDDAFGRCVEEGLEALPVPEERVLDRLALAQADLLKDPQGLGVEIYVIALDVCSPNNIPQSPNYCSGVGDSANDDISNQRLLKCIASSPEHYQSVTLAQLPTTFQQLASEIVSRSLLQ